MGPSVLRGAVRAQACGTRVDCGAFKGRSKGDEHAAAPCRRLHSRTAAGDPSAEVTAIRAGRLIDPGGCATANALILVEGEKITAVGANVAVPQSATVIDLSDLSVLPGSSTLTPISA